MAVVGGGSSAVQIIPNIQPKVGQLYAFLRSPVWVTTGFGAKYAGPGGTNFAYSEDQLREFNEKPELYTKYARDIEGELNKRFNLMHINSKDQKQSRELIRNLMAERINNEVRFRTSDLDVRYPNMRKANNEEYDPSICTRLPENDPWRRIS